MEHRELAVRTYGEAWELLGRQRSPEQDRDLLGAALTSRYHWRQVGGPQQRAIADWMAARALAARGDGRGALSFARAALEATPADAPAWLRASLHEGVARACAAAGDAEGRERHVAAARDALREEPDDDDRDLVSQQLDDVPPVS